MRPRFLLPVVLTLSVAAPALVMGVARAQISDAERLAARDLFKQGDELQRAGKYADALDKFQRAQQVIQAPTNVLRIAECQAQLNKLVEATESYRAVVRWPLAAGAPAAFQSAIDQAKGELAQVEPRVPKLLVQVTPTNVTNESLVIDGTAVPAALVGEPIPLDPGEHRVTVTATGYASPEQAVTLKERETRTLNVQLQVSAGTLPPPPPPAASSSAQPPPPPPPAYGSSSSEPAQPPPYEPEKPPERKDTRGSILLGAHLGLEIPAGQVPLSASFPQPSPVSIGDISGPGLGYGLDVGVRFLHNWYLGLTLDHAELVQGKNLSSVGDSTGSIQSNTTSFGLIGAFIATPEKLSFLGEIGLQNRWYNFQFAGSGTQSYSSGELLVGIGLWIPVGRFFRMVPLGTVGFGDFTAPGASASSGGPAHAFVMLGVDGFYNIDL